MQYFRDTMTYVRPEPRHKLCEGWYDNHITLQQAGKDNFAVRYGKQVDAGLTYSQACSKLGQAFMHHLSCESKVDNRHKGER